MATEANPGSDEDGIDSQLTSISGGVSGRLHNRASSPIEGSVGNYWLAE